MFAMIGTRPDYGHTISMLSRFNVHLDTTHHGATKRALHYTKSTVDHGITYGGQELKQGQGPTLRGYSDSDWAGDPDTRRSTNGYVFMLNGGAISWKCNRQSTVALSSTEAEYRGYMEAAKEAIWLR